MENDITGNTHLPPECTGVYKISFLDSLAILHTLAHEAEKKSR